MTSRPPNLGQRRLAGYRPPDRGTQPDYLYPPYSSTVKRSPLAPLVLILPPRCRRSRDRSSGTDVIKANDFDLTKQHAGDPIGERIIVSGRVLDANARPVPTRWWKSGRPTRPAAIRTPRPAQRADRPQFHRLRPYVDRRRGPVPVRDDQSRAQYPWRNHYNAWRPAHIHFSLFGPAISTRLVTQMYFPGDPLLDIRPDVHQHSRRARAPATGLGVRLGDDDSRAGTRLPLRHRVARTRRNADGKRSAARGPSMSASSKSIQVRERNDEPCDHIIADGRSVSAHRPRPG